MEYWLGRYIACHDRIRNAEHESMHRYNEQRGFSDTSRSSANTDSNIALRRRVLVQLRTFCQTEAAVNSFKKFEHYLYQPTPIREGNQRRTPSATSIFSCRTGAKQKDDSSAHTVSKTRKMSRSISSTILKKPSAPGSTSQHVATSTRPLSPQNTDLTYVCLVATPKKLHQRNMSWRSLDFGREIPLFKKPALSSANIETEIMCDEPGIQSACTKNFSDQDERVHQMPDGVRKAQVLLNTSGLAQSESLPSMMSGELSSSSHTSFVTAFSSDKSAQSGVVTLAGLRTEHDSNVSTVEQGTRRFRKSGSMKKLVDVGIREIRKIGHRVSHQSGHDSPD